MDGFGSIYNPDYYRQLQLTKNLKENHKKINIEIDIDDSDEELLCEIYERSLNNKLDIKDFCYILNKIMNCIFNGNGMDYRLKVYKAEKAKQKIIETLYSWYESLTYMECQELSFEQFDKFYKTKVKSVINFSSKCEKMVYEILSPNTKEVYRPYPDHPGYINMINVLEKYIMVDVAELIRDEEKRYYCPGGYYPEIK